MKVGKTCKTIDFWKRRSKNVPITNFKKIYKANCKKSLYKKEKAAKLISILQLF